MDSQPQNKESKAAAINVNEESMGAGSRAAASSPPLGYRDMEVVVDGIRIPVRYMYAIIVDFGYVRDCLSVMYACLKVCICV